MKITERKLRRIIRSVIRESMSSDYSDQITHDQHDHEGHFDIDPNQGDQVIYNDEYEYDEYEYRDDV